MFDCNRDKILRGEFNNQNSSTRTSSSEEYSYNTSSQSAKHLSLFEDKENVKFGYDSIIRTLSSITSMFRELNIENPNLSSQRRKLVDKLDIHIKDIKNEKDEALLPNKWDKLTIGLFGETNAGKSTIIESLRILLQEKSRENVRRVKGSCDGEIVGDGRQDFTQTYHEYEMMVNGQNFCLIDVPGIEGKENLYKGKIGEALRKAHLIFYVNGHNKNIDRGTAAKVKEYMGEGVQIVVLQNMRGNVDQFEEPEDRKTIITSATNTILKAIEKDFRGLVGDKFAMSIPVMGLLAMCAYGEFSSNRKDLKNKQSILLEYFKEDNLSEEQARNKIRQLSNIDAVIHAISSRANNYKREIAKANFVKLEMFSHRVLREFIEEIEGKRIEFESYKKQVERFIRENKDDASTTQQQFKLELQRIANDMVNNYSEKVYYCIECSDYSTLKRKAIEEKSALEGKIKILITNYSQAFIKRVNDRIKRLTAIPCMDSAGISSVNINTPNFSDDLNSVIDEDDISSGDVARTVGSTATGAATGAMIGSVIPVIGSLVGGIIGGIVGGGAGIGKSASAQRERAKEEAHKKLRTLRSKLTDKMSDISISFGREIDKEVLKINNVAKSRSGEIDLFHTVATNAETELRKSVCLIKEYGKK